MRPGSETYTSLCQWHTVALPEVRQYDGNLKVKGALQLHCYGDQEVGQGIPSQRSCPGSLPASIPNQMQKLQTRCQNSKSVAKTLNQMQKLQINCKNSKPDANPLNQMQKLQIRCKNSKPDAKTPNQMQKVHTTKVLRELVSPTRTSPRPSAKVVLIQLVAWPRDGEKKVY